MRWPVLYLAVVGALLLQSDSLALAQQPLVPIVDGRAWTGETVNDSATTAHLENAVMAFRAALQEYTRERAPLQWAATQTNLGTALAILSERNKGKALKKVRTNRRP
jgi:hypothetical protein